MALVTCMVSGKEERLAESPAGYEGGAYCPDRSRGGRGGKLFAPVDDVRRSEVRVVDGG